MTAREAISKAIRETLQEENKGRPFEKKELKRVENLINGKIKNIVEDNKIFRVVLKLKEKEELSVSIQTRDLLPGER